MLHGACVHHLIPMIINNMRVCINVHITSFYLFYNLYIQLSIHSYAYKLANPSLYYLVAVQQRL